MHVTRLKLAGLGLAAALAWAAPGWAAPYTAEYVFGDSLSDNGNLAEVFYHRNLPNPPSANNSFTNGPVAAALLANRLGLTLTPSLWVTAFQDTFGLYGGASFQPGTNYAVAGATAANQAVGGPAGINLPTQVAAFGAFVGGVADPNALYVVDIGGNDVRNAARQGTGGTAIAAGVSAEVGAVSTLAALGARNFLVVNVPNVGVIPEFAQDNPVLAATATLYSQQYNALLASSLSALTAQPGISLTQFDLYNYNAGLIARASSLGFTNTTDRCFTATPLSAATTPQCGPNGANIDQFFYWDSIHPSARVQALWAVGFENAIGVPEPASLTLLGLGLAGLVGVGRRRLSSGTLLPAGE